MKKILLSVIALMITHTLFAQWTTGTDIYNTNTGNVGIGTTNPTLGALQVGSGTSYHPVYNQVWMNDGTADLDVAFAASGKTSRHIGIAPSGDYFYLGRDGAIRDLVISSTGHVSIGTTIPSSKLDIMGSYADVSLNANAEATLSLRTLGHVQVAINTQLAGPYTTSFQAKHSTANGAVYPIALNPLGGNVGIGTTSPSVKLEVDNGSALINNSVLADLGGQLTISNHYGNQNGAVRLNLNNGGAVNWIKGIVTGPNTNTGSAMVFGVASNTSDGTEAMRLTSNGNLLIGKDAQDNLTYKLDIHGKARANEIVVNSDGADFVFEPNYELPKLSDVKDYIDQSHHLPQIPSATEMQKNGMSVGELNTKLLQKVEELTLYLIEENKKNKEQQKKLEQQEVRMAALEAALLNINDSKK
jgi:hypothetical protein